MKSSFQIRVLALLAVLLVFTSENTIMEGKRKKHAHIVPVMLTCPQLTPIKDVTYTPIRRLEKEVRLIDTISITFIGDVMQHGKQLKSALREDTDPNNPESYDYSHVFRHIKGQLQKADLSVANMECPLGTPPYSGYPIFSAPESIAWEAAASGIDLFLLANNHIMDKGETGFLNTIEVYEKMGAKYIGAYRTPDEKEALYPAFFNIKGIRVAFLNFSYGTNGFPVPQPCTVNLMDSTDVKKDIAKAREMGADIIICTPHWGEEYMLNPSLQQKKWAQMLHREGVGIIVGSHPHVPQAAEISPKKILFYSLGNYISNQSTPDYTQLELMVTVRIQKNNHTGETILLEPEYEFLWCFKKDEFAPCYTVVPVKEILGREELVKDKAQYARMEKTYRSFIEKGLIVDMF